MKDKYSVWHLLHKLSDNEILELNINLSDPYSQLPDNYVTDGWGNVYKIPNSGVTPLVTINDNNYMKYRYNWGDRAIEVFMLSDEDNDEVNNYKYFDSAKLDVYNYIDNPEYWYDKLFNDYIDEIDSMLESEAIDVINESISYEDDQYEYEYILISYVNLFVDNDNDWSDAIEDIEDYLSEYESDSILYHDLDGNNEKLQIELSLDVSAGDIYLQIKIESPVELDKTDFDIIFEDIKFDIENHESDKIDYTIKLISGYNV